MKQSPLTKVLLVLAVISVLMSLVLCWSFVGKARQLRLLQSQMQFLNTTSAQVNALLGEAVEYSKKNPAIDPLLESFGAKPGKAGPAPATSPTMTPTRSGK